MNETHLIADRHGEKDRAIQLIDCGQASAATRGLPLFLLFELGWPPNNKMFLI